MIRLALVAAGLVLAAPAASAGTLTWRISGVGTGTLAGEGFDGRFTFILRGNTANHVVAAELSEISPLDSARIRIAGHGRAAFGEAMRLGFNSGTQAVYLAPAAELGDIFDFYVPEPVDLTRPLASIVGQTFGLPWIADVPTLLGDLRFESSSEVTFAAVPLPASAPLLLAALGAAGLLARRSRRAA